MNLTAAKGRLEKIYDLLFPPFCLGCGRGTSYICQQCLVLAVEAEPICPGCGYPATGGKRHRKCPSSLDGLVAVWERRGLIDKALRTVEARQAVHLLEFMTLKGLTVLLDQEMPDFWSVWADRSTEIRACPSERERKARLRLSGKMVEVLSGYAGSSVNGSVRSDRPRIILAGLFFHPEMAEEAARLKKEGFSEVWSLVLARKSC